MKIEEQAARIAALEADLEEQCRLHGIGASREARLLARIAELERALARSAAYREYAGRMLDGLFDFGDIDGGEQQDVAHATGMIEPYIVLQDQVDAETNPHDCYAGDEAFRFTALGHEALAAARAKK